jgi:hypothetical protein
MYLNVKSVITVSHTDCRFHCCGFKLHAYNSLGLSSGNACYHLVNNFFSSCLLPKSVNIRREKINSTRCFARV